MTPVTPRAAERMLGQHLAGGWTVVSRIVKPLDATGGHFSVGYVVETAQGRRGFLKALDYSEAFQPQMGVPVSVALQELTESINFEKYVLARCRERGLDKIVI